MSHSEDNPSTALSHEATALSDEALDRQLASLATATESLEPQAAFVDVVMSAIDEATAAEPAWLQEGTGSPLTTVAAAQPMQRRRANDNDGWAGSIVRSSSWAFAAAALLAVTSLVFSNQAASDYDEALMAGIDTVEIAE